MTSLQKLLIFMDLVLQEERGVSREMLAGYVVGELLGDYDNIYEKLREDNKQSLPAI